MQHRWIYMLLLVGVGFASGYWLQDKPEATINTPDDGSATSAQSSPLQRQSHENAKRLVTELDALHRLLQGETDARHSLEQQVAELRRELAALKADMGHALSMQDTSTSEATLTQATGQRQGWFDEQALVDSGMDASQASELKRYFEQLELERLFLRDQGEREDWSRQELREAMRAVDQREDELKSRLSESAYDAYLYASGQTNRITVASVLDSAQAGTAGIKSGDHIIRYDNQRIYNWSDLRTAITGGNAGDSVTLEIDRDGERIEFYLARGPLGIRTNSLSLPP